MGFTFNVAARYSAVCLVRTKNKGEIIKQIYAIWIAYFGSPNKFLSDRSWEFSNDLLQEMNEKSKVETRMTAEESPFSKCIVEDIIKFCWRLSVKR